MGRSAFRGMVSCVLMVLFPGSMFAADSSAAMLYTNGPAWINGTHVPRPALAIFSGDLFQTRRDSSANINEPGSSITVLSDSLVKFEVSSLRIEHGGVSVVTSKGLATTAGEVKIAPVSNTRTEFDVSDVDGTVRIAARTGDLTVSDGSETMTLAQGQQTTRDETSDNSDKSDSDKNGKRRKKTRMAGAAPAAANGGILSSPYAIAAGAAIVGGVSIWVLTKSDNPVSPAVP